MDFAPTEPAPGELAPVFYWIFYCLPLFQEFSAFQDQNGSIGNSVSVDLYPNLNSSVEEYGWQETINEIEAYEDYRQCPWDNLETLEPNASESEITRAKETYLTQHGSEAQNIEDCFTPLVLEMQKEGKDCKSICTRYYQEQFEKYETYAEAEADGFLTDFSEKAGVSSEYLSDCIDYISITFDRNNTLQNLGNLDELPFQIVTCIISIVGLVGNLALFVIYVRKDQKIRFNTLMLLITSFDFFYNVIGIAEFFENETLEWLILFLYGFTITGSVWATTLVTIERYLLLCKEKYITYSGYSLHIFEHNCFLGKLTNILSTGPFCSSLLLQFC